MGNSTGKCRTCSEGKCERKYKNRKRCDDPNNCTCTCQEEAIETFAKGFSSIGYGMCAVTVSVVFTLATAGAGLGAVATIAALSGCSALTGVGSAMIIHPVEECGGAAHLSGNVVNKVVETGVGRSATKVTADTVSTFIIDTSSQMIENDGKVDGEKLLFNLVSRATTSAGSEAISSLCYNDQNNKKLPKTSKQKDKAAHGPQGPTGNERPTGTFSQ